MSEHITDERLQDWLDARLDATEAARVNAHVVACPVCAREADALRALLVELHALPRGIRPHRDLHEGVAARIDAGSTSHPAPLRRAAAFALLVTGAAAAALSLREPPAPAGTTTFRETHAEYARAVGQLEDAVRTRAGLAPEAAAALDRSLTAIDAALDEAGRALADDPASVLLNELMLVSYAQKLDVLRRATDPSSP